MLDKAEIPIVGKGMLEKRDGFVVVDSPQQHRVHFHRQQAGFLGSLDTRDHVVESITVRHFLKALWIQSVQTDIDSLESCFSEIPCEFR